VSTATATTELVLLTEKLSLVKGFFCVKDNYLGTRVSVKRGLRRGYKYGKIRFKK